MGGSGTAEGFGRTAGGVKSQVLTLSDSLGVESGALTAWVGAPSSAPGERLGIGELGFELT